MIHFIMYWLGLTNASGPQYLFWSGICGDLFIVGGIVTLYKKHNCHVQGCFRIGKHIHEGTPYCTLHNPKFDGK